MRLLNLALVLFSRADTTPTTVVSAEHFDSLLGSHTRLIADFTGRGCKPCGFITRKYTALAREYDGVKFVVVDVLDHRALAERYGVDGLPTFVMFRGAERVDACAGVDEEALEGGVKRLAAG